MYAEAAWMDSRPAQGRDEEVVHRTCVVLDRNSPADMRLPLVRSPIWPRSHVILSAMADGHDVSQPVAYRPYSLELLGWSIALVLLQLAGKFRSASVR